MEKQLCNPAKNSVKMRFTTVMKVMQRSMTKGYTKGRKHNKVMKLRKVSVIQARHRKTGPENASRLTKTNLQISYDVLGEPRRFPTSK